jgi:hypothetical protein
VLGAILGFGSSGRIRTYNPSVNSRKASGGLPRPEIHAFASGSANRQWGQQWHRGPSVGGKPGRRSAPASHGRQARTLWGVGVVTVFVTLGGPF